MTPTFWRRLSSPAVTLVAANVVLFAGPTLSLVPPTPGAVMLVAVLFSTLLGGVWSGLVSAAISIVYGVFPGGLPDRPARFHKQLGIHDLYFDGDRRRGAGSIQQVQSPPVGLVRAHLPPGVGALLSPLIPRMTGLLAMAEDVPQPSNHVALDATARDRFGRPQGVISYRHAAADLAARGRCHGAWVEGVREIDNG